MANTAASLNTFSHIAVVYSQGTVKLYLNFQLVGSGSGVYIPSSAPLWIGQGSDNFQGVIDEVRITAKPRPEYLLLHLDEGSGNPQDSSGHNNTVTNYGATWTTGGKIGSALEFDVDELDITGEVTQSLRDDFTLEAWVKPSAWPGWRNGIFHQEQYLVNGFRCGFDAGGYLRFWTSQSGGNIDVGANTAASLNTFSHIAVVYSQGTVKLYLNFQLVGSGSGVYIPSSAPLWIGVGADWFQGVIDEVRITAEPISNDIVVLGKAPTLNLTGAVTIQLWVKTTSTKTESFLVSKYDINNNYEGYEFSLVGDNRIRFQLRGGTIGSAELLSPDNPVFIVKDNIWHHVAATYDGSMMRIYRDGVEIASRAQTGTFGPGVNGDVGIGARPFGTNPAYGYQGLIDEVGIYDHALSAAEIAYSATHSIAPPSYILSVTHFGAFPNDLQDDTKSIRAAIDSLPPGAGGIYFPGGLYEVSDVIQCRRAFNKSLPDKG